jgi:hypothetical protein
MARAGLMRIKLGDTIKPIAVERYKASKAANDVICVLTADISAAHLHFVKGIGGFYCFGGACCKFEGLPSIRYIVPILKYTMTDQRNFVYGAPVFVQYLSAAKERYEEILRKNKINGDITSVDMLVSCQDEIYQKLSLEVLSKAAWKEDASLAPEVKTQYAEYNNLIEQSVARVIDEPTFLKLYAALDQNQSSVPQVTFAAQRAEEGQLSLNPSLGSTTIDIATDANGDPDFSDLLAPDPEISKVSG